MDLKIVNGEKLNYEFGIQPIAFSSQIQGYIVALSEYVFSIILQGNWTKKEIRNAENRLTMDIAEIDGVLDIVLDIDKCIIADVAYHASNTNPNIQFQHLEEEKGIAFHIIFIDLDTTVLYQRLCSLDTDKSNDFVNVLLEQQSLNIDKDIYNSKVLKLYNEMSIEEIKSNSFIHQNFHKGR